MVAIAIGAMLFMRRRRRTPAEPVVAPEAVPLTVTGPAEPLLLASEETSAQRQLIAALHHVVDTRPDEALAVIRSWIAGSEAA
jgi:flagellar biosynthesis/type III secretory pathway M-ring protein FliF/YscJ